MRSGCAPDVSGANDPAPAEDVLNENPSLVALGKKDPFEVFGPENGNPRPAGSIRQNPGLASKRVIFLLKSPFGVKRN